MENNNQEKEKNPLKKWVIILGALCAVLLFTTLYFGFSSLSTSPLCNAHCIERMKSDVAVCKHCFSARMQKRYKTLRIKLERNTELLTKTELQPEDIPFLNMAFFRFESFGDLNNTLQVKNYFLIAERNPHCTMALWTKNPWIIADAMSEYGVKNRIT